MNWNELTYGAVSSLAPLVDLPQTLTPVHWAIFASAAIACVLVPISLLRSHTLRKITTTRDQIHDFDRRAKIVERLFLGYANSFSSYEFKQLEELIRIIYKLKRDVDLSQDLLRRGQRGPAKCVLKKCLNLSGYLIREDPEISINRFDHFCEGRIQQLGAMVVRVYDGLNKVGISPSIRGEDIIGRLKEAGVAVDSAEKQAEYTLSRAA